jgi:hypothetical protein
VSNLAIGIDCFAGGASAPVTPKTILGASLMAWYRTALAATVSAWPDQSGNGDASRNAVQATGAQQPTLTPANASFNGRPSLNFPSSGMCMRTGIWSVPRNQPITIFVVGMTSAASGYWLDARVDTGTSQQAINNGATAGMYAGASVAGGVDTSVPSVIAAAFNGLTSSFYVRALTPVIMSANAGANNCDGMTIGNYAGGGGFNHGGSMTEIVVANGVPGGSLSIANFNKMMHYLGTDYAITIGS